MRSIGRGWRVGGILASALLLGPWVSRARAGDLQGVVTDAVSAAPLAGITVAVYDSGGSLVATGFTDPSGAYVTAPPLPSGTYFARTFNASGYLDELFDNLECRLCNVTAGTPIVVTAGSATTGIDFALVLGGRVSGRVVDASSGDPLPGVAVFVYDSGGGLVASQATDATGAYVAGAPLPTGTYFARTINSIGYLDELFDDLACSVFSCNVTTGTPIAVTAGTTSTGIDFALAAGGRIAGRVTDAVSGSPLAFVSVQVYDAGGRFVTSLLTDGSGSYLTGFGLPTGTYFVLTASSPQGYIDELFDNLVCLGCDVTGGTPVAVSAGTTSTGIDFALVPGARISGRVTDSSGAPLPVATIQIYDAGGRFVSSGFPDATGAYLTFSGLPTGTYFARTFNSSGYVDELFDDISCPNCNPTSGTPITATVGATTTGIDFSLALGGQISGRVVDSSSSAPLAGVSVQVYDSGGRFVGSGVTDTTGAYLVASGLPAGTYFARTFNASGYVDELFDNLSCPTCDVTSGTPITVTAGSTTAGVDFALALGGRISGRIVDSSSSLPLAGVTVEIYNASGRFVSSGSANAAGDYLTGPGLPTGTYFARTFNASGYVDKLFDNLACAGCSVTAGTPIAVTAGATTTGVDFALALGGRISGRVTDSSSGAGLPGVNVEVYDSQGRFVSRGFTSATGAYLTGSGLPTGSYFARTFNSSAYVDELFDDLVCPSCSVTTGAPIAVTAGSTTAGIDFALARGGRISGRVVDSASSAPLSNAFVQVYDSSGRFASNGPTDASGAFLTGPGLPTGSYFVRTFNSQGYLNELFDDLPCLVCTVTSGTPVAVTAASTTSGIDFALSRGGRISGRITDAVSGLGLVGVEVDLYDSSEQLVGRSFTDAVGNYLIGPGLPTGSYFVRTFNSLAYLDELFDDFPCLTCTVTTGTPVAVTVGSLTSGIDFALTLGGRISGRVTDVASGTPLAGIRVDVYRPDGSRITTATTDAAGAYLTSTGLPSGTYFARTSNPSGYVDELYDNIPCPACSATGGTPIAVTAGATTSGIDFALGAGGRVAGRVTDAVSGAPLAGVSVDLYDVGGRFVSSGFTDAAGSYLTGAGVPAGSYFARTFNSAGYLDELFDDRPCTNCAVTLGTPIAVTAGGTTSGIDFALAVGGRISGRVTDASSGVPLADVTVNVYDSGGRFVTRGFTDGTGDYVTEAGLPTGSYFARTFNDLGYVEELFDNVPCLNCTVTTGTPIAVTVGSTTSGIDLALARGGQIAGRVTDAASGAPLANVRLDVSDSTGRLVTSDFTSSTGAYLTGSGLPTGSYFVRTSNGQGYVDELFDDIPCLGCSVAAGAPVAVTAGSTTTGIDFGLTVGGRITGQVTVAGSASPLTAVSVQVYDATGRFLTSSVTNLAGVYLTAVGLPTGSYFVRTSNSQAYLDELFDNLPCVSCTVTTGNPVAVTVGSTTSGIDFALVLGGRISGRVTDTSGAPLAGVNVSIYDATGRFVTSRVTDASGSYLTTQGLATGTYFARTFNSFGYFDDLFDDFVCANCNVVTGTPIAVTTGSITSGIDFALALGGRVSGRITDAVSGAPLPGVTVQIFDAGGRLVTSRATDAAGVYLTTLGLVSGSYFARTSNTLGYIDELFDNLPCLSCSPLTGTPIAVTAGSTTAGIDFVLGVGGRFSGRVTDAVTGAPLAGVTVQVFDATGRSLASRTTDATGSYLSIGLVTGTYFARTINQLGYVDELFDNIPCLGCTVTAGVPIAVTVGSTTSGIDFALVAGGRISGRVTDSATGAPLSGVSVQIYDATGRFVTNGSSDASGSYVSFSGLTTGTYFARTFNSQGYVEELFDGLPCLNCNVVAGAPVPVTLGATTPGIDFALAAGGRISGRVTDAGTGTPLSGLRVDIYRADGRSVTSATTGATGIYTSNSGLPTGSYFVRTANTLGYVDELFDNQACLACDVTGGTPVAVTAGATVPGIDFALDPGARVSGRVTDALSGLGLSNVSVSILDGMGRTVAFASTDATGAYRTGAGLSTGTYFARTANSAGYIDELFDNVVCLSCVPTGGTPISVSSPGTTSGIDFALRPGGSISGRVTDAGTGSPLAGVTVTVSDTAGRSLLVANTDSTGAYRVVRGLPTGLYYARTSNSLGYVNKVYNQLACCNTRLGTPIAVTEGAVTAGIDFSLDRGGTIRGTVTDDISGAPLSGLSVLIFDATGRFAGAGTTDARGVYLSDGGFPAGSYFAHTSNSRDYVSEIFDGVECLTCRFSQAASPETLTGTPIPVTVGAATSGIDFALGRGGTFSGRIIDAATSQPLAGIVVQAHDSTGRALLTATTNPFGVYTLPSGLPPGTYHARTLRGSGYASQLYSALPCPLGCDPTSGAAITLSMGVTTPGIDFALVRARAQKDFNADGHDDVLWRNQSTGQNVVWLVQGSTVVSEGALPTVADPNARIVGVGDFDGDGKADAFWRHATTGDNALWFLEGTGLRSAAALVRVADVNWRVVGVGDFDGDGKADVLWRNVATGDNAVWLMDGSTVRSSVVLPRLADLDWAVVGVGDVDANGKADVLWHHAGTGDNGVWIMDGTTVLSTPLLPRLADLNWQVMGFADFDGDGQADVFWRHAGTGANGLWRLSGATLLSTAVLPGVPVVSWSVEQVADHSGDGKADIVWRQAAGGANLLWVMDGGSVTAALFLPAIADLNWTSMP